MEKRGRETKAGAGHELLDDRAHGGGAQQHRLLAAAAMEQPVGEDMAALEIGGELDLVDGEEGDIDVGRHGLDGADPEARLAGMIFSSPVTSATAWSPTRRRTRS